MKKSSISIIAVMLMAVLVTGLCACNKVNLSGDVKDDKHMEIVADGAAKGDYIVSGGLVVEDGEQIVMDYALEKGKIELAFIKETEEQSSEELPDADAEPELKTEVSGTAGGSGVVPSGTYMVKVTCTEKAKGTVNLSVEPFGE